MASFHGVGKYRQKPVSTTSDDEYDEDVNVIYLEESIPTLAAQVPELKKKTSFWQIGSVSLSRVKINALRSNVTIHADKATTIEGSYANFYAPIETLGTTVIHVCNVPIEIHVTRSEQCTPAIADGFLGIDFMDKFDYAKGEKGKFTFYKPNITITASPPEELIENYMQKLHRKFADLKVAQKKGPWSVVSKDLLRLRDFLPSQVSEDNRLSVIETLGEYSDCFYLPGDNLGATSLLKYSLSMEDTVVVNTAQYRIPHDNWNEIERQVKNLLNQKIIRVSESPYNSPVRLIEKKPDSKGNVSFRLAIDFRELNNRCHGDAFPIPDIVSLVDQLHGAKYFSVLDLASASYQIALHPSDRSKTAFTTRSGRYEFLRMPAGIKNASQTLQRLMNQLLNGMFPNMAFVCYDDILIYAPTLAEHEIRVRRVLARLRDAGLKLQPDKCQLFRSSVNYLGYRVTEEGLRPDPAKIHKLKIHPLPDSVHSLRSYLGLFGFFERFIPNYATRAHAMSNLLKTKDKLEWNEAAQQSFDDLKKALSEDWVLRYPNWDREFILETSSSDFGVNAALMQRKTGDSPALPIAYASRCYTSAEAKENLYNRERLAAIYGMESFYWYFEDGKKFTLLTPQPNAFEWYAKRQRHNCDILGRFEITFSGKHFRVHRLSTAM